MAKDLAHPLAGILAQAKKLPATTGATARAANPVRVVILADVSGSMGDMAGARRKADHLEDALRLVQSEHPADLVAFSAVPKDVPAGRPLPPPSGGTALHLALAHVTRAETGHVVVISDGAPDNRGSALQQARVLVQRGTTISTVYVGQDGDHAAIRFMEELAALGRGRAHRYDLMRHASTARLADTLRLALPAPRR